MAANLTLLAMQCAAGVAAPSRCLQLRRNLITKTHKTTIMATNPALQYDAGVPMFTPCQLHRNAVSIKRNKTIVAAYPTKVELISGGIPLYTVGTIGNYSGQTISLDDEDIWQGSRTTNFPEKIEDQDVGDFTHSAESRGKILGSIGALEYKLDDGTKWIIAWSNPLFELNKVYTEILKTRADWEEIKASLEAKGAQNYSTTDFGFFAELEIDPTSDTPTMKATLKPLILLKHEEKKA